jgi:hypothetical protein
LIIVAFLFSCFSLPNASGFELKSECISTTMASQYPFLKPGSGNTAEYKIAYQNNCSKEISSVEISIVERDGYDYRILTSGGRLGKVLDKQKGQVTLSLSYSVFSDVKDTMFLSIKENYPLESKVKQALRNLDFTSAPTPTIDRAAADKAAADAKAIADKAAAAAADKAAVESFTAENGGFRITWPSRVYMPQTAAEERDPKYGYMVVKFENLNTSGFFTRLQANIYSSIPLQVTGEKIVPTLGVHGAVNSGIKGEMKIPLSYLFFLGMKGPLKASLHLGACETVLQCNVGIIGEFTFEHLKFDAISASSKAAADKAAADKAATDKAAADKAAADKAAAKIIADANAQAAAILAAAQAKVVAQKKTTITCIKGKLTKKVTAVKPVCPPGYKKK